MNQSSIFFEKQLINVVMQCNIDMLLVHKVKKLAVTDRFTETLTLQMVGSSVSIKPVTPFVKCHIDKSNQDCRVGRILEHQRENDQLVHSREDDEIPTQWMP